MENLGNITAAILAGGTGTRLRSVVSDRPKVLAEVCGRPFLAFLLDRLADVGIRRVVLCTGYRAEQVEETFGLTYRNMALAYSREDRPLGTGGALRHALPRIDSADVLVLNGDSFCDADLTCFWDWHRSTSAAASLVLVEVPDTSRYGCVEADEAGRVVRFVEKGGKTASDWINAGIYLLGRKQLAQIPATRPVSLEREIFPCWLRQGLYGWRVHSDFIDIGTPQSYRLAQRVLADRVSVGEAGAENVERTA